MAFNEKIFRKYDIRGIVGEDIDNDFIKKVAKGYYIYLTKNLPREKYKIAIGYDGRKSSPGFAKIFAQEMVKYGADVVWLNLVPSPLMYYAVYKKNLDGGIMITASHNPKEFNGIKILMENNSVFDEELQKLKDYAKSDIFPKEENNGKIEKIDIIADYIVDMYEKFSYLKDYPEINFVVDCGNGAAGALIPRLLDRLGWKYIGPYTDVDGDFPNHHPDPTVEENNIDLVKIVKENNAEIGLGFDGDGDRLGVVSPDGRLWGGDQVLYTYIKDYLESKKSGTFVSEVKCSQVLFDNVEKLGGKIYMWLAGHALLKAKMKEEKADIAGEMSGHFFFKHRFYGYDDAAYALLRFIEIMRKAKKENVDFRADDLLNDWEKLEATPELRLDFDDEKKFQIAGILEEYFNKNKEKFEIKDIITIDGIRVIFEKGWGLIRASNTQPAIVMRFEADNKENLTKYMDLFQESIKLLLNEDINYNWEVK